MVRWRNARDRMSDVTTMTELLSRSIEAARESGLAPEVFETLVKGLRLGSQLPDPKLSCAERYPFVP